MVWLLAACSPAADVVIDDAWIRAAPPGAHMLAAYGTITNQRGDEIVIQGVESAQFASVSVHESLEINGTATMRPAGDLRLAPGQSIDLRPGGLHFMLMGPTAEFDRTQQATIRLLFDDGSATEHRFSTSDPATPTR
ncbi:MAG: copper chaperone PCu(A)C [Gammaproteobacteria bacterium]|nr:copper chaperone PCu(A)C [Gammaproteobacteria bacterium]